MPTTFFLGEFWQLTPAGNDLLSKVHNPLNRLFGHEKTSAMGQLPKQIPIFLKCLPKILFLRGQKWHFGIYHTLSYSPKVFTQSLKFIKNSLKVHQKSLKTDKTMAQKRSGARQLKFFWYKVLSWFNLPLKLAVNTDSDCWKKWVSAVMILHR